MSLKLTLFTPARGPKKKKKKKVRFCNFAAPFHRSLFPPFPLAKKKNMGDAGKLFVGGLSWNTDDNSLRSAFEKFGNVAEGELLYVIVFVFVCVFTIFLWGFRNMLPRTCVFQHTKSTKVCKVWCVWCWCSAVLVFVSKRGGMARAFVCVCVSGGYSS